MADTTAMFKGGAAPMGNSTSSNATPASTVTTSAPAAGGSILDIMKGMTSPSVLSPEGKAYINKIADTVRAAGHEVKLTRILGSNYEAYAIESEGKTWGFVMGETFAVNGDTLPQAACITDFRNAMTYAKIDPATLVSFVIVDKDWYAKVDIMAAFIANWLTNEDNTAIKHLSVQAFEGQLFHVTTDTNVVKQFVAQVYPGPVLPRCDVGLLVYGTKTVNGMYRPDGKPEIEKVPLVAVTGYTDFVYTKAGGVYASETRHAPVFVITGIWSRLPNAKMTALGLTIATHVMITKGHWLEPYSTYAKGSPDIGNLTTDATTGKMFSVQDIMGRNRIVNEYLTTRLPYLALDVQLGAPLMPGLREIFSDPQAFNVMVDSFTGGHAAQDAKDIRQLERKRFDGTVRLVDNGTPVVADTRCVDFLYLVGRNVQPSECRDLCCFMLDQDPLTDAQKRSEIVKKLMPTDYKLLYITTRTILRPSWILNVANMIGKSVALNVEGNYNETTYDVGTLEAFDMNNMLTGFAAPAVAGSNFGLGAGLGF